MSAPASIVCKPTPWFFYRAAALLVMFSVFAVLFYNDASTGYRKKNEVYYLYQTFDQASQRFSAMNAERRLTPAEWKSFAAAQTVSFPEDKSILPAATDPQMPWPEILHDYERMKLGDWNQLWIDYTGERGLPASPPEKSHDASSIREQWIVLYICLALTLVTLFFLIRTSRRTIIADDEGIITQQGRRICYAEMVRLDLRKWDTKGIALIDCEGGSGNARVRIDGLTYGGFKKERDEPAEKLMQKIQSNFSGELIQYTSVSAKPDVEAAANQPETAAK